MLIIISLLKRPCARWCPSVLSCTVNLKVFEFENQLSYTGITLVGVQTIKLNPSNKLNPPPSPDENPPPLATPQGPLEASGSVPQRVQRVQRPAAAAAAATGAAAGGVGEDEVRRQRLEMDRMAVEYGRKIHKWKVEDDGRWTEDIHDDIWRYGSNCLHQHCSVNSKSGYGSIQTKSHQRRFSAQFAAAQYALGFSNRLHVPMLWRW